MNAAVAAIQFALEDDDPVQFLRYWNEGQFDVLRRNWPDAPEEVYIGADPLHPKTVIGPTSFISQANIDHIGEQWDGCLYDAPGEFIDIGKSIRVALAQLNEVPR